MSHDNYIVNIVLATTALLVFPLNPRPRSPSKAPADIDAAKAEIGANISPIRSGIAEARSYDP